MDNGHFDQPTGLFYDSNKKIVRWDKEETFWKNYYEYNKKRYKYVGLDEEVLREERKWARELWEVGARTNVGVLEAKGVVDRQSSIFSSTDITVYDGTNSDHANKVAEVIVGKQGINPYASLYSDKTYGITGVKGSIEWLVKNGVYIINNSWGETDGYDENSWITYQDNPNAIWLDNFINENPEVVFIKAAGNDIDRRKFDDNNNPITYKTPGYIAMYIESFSLSYNSIIVGALENTKHIKPEYFTEFSKYTNYISVSAPDQFTSQYAIDHGTKPNVYGTSFATPTVSAIATLLKTNYSPYFNIGADSLIMKSILISGARNNEEDNILYNSSKNINPKTYDGNIGFGRVNFLKAKEALQRLRYFKMKKTNTYTNPAVERINMKKGTKYRVNATWMNVDSLKSEWITTFLFFGYPKYTHIGAIPISVNLYTPSNQKIKVYNEMVFSGQAEKANTITFEFTATETGSYAFNFSFDTDRKRDLDVAFTYSTL
ncbi:hypothetical protein CJJ23_04295 [Mycoplasmopsis agassizii]|uniref:Peptidase S8/S53 domain-containing protein n=1 Tax=Mycoplasmopsis agassizii TaxID=33922 RepID=A0A269THR2_9BACT|nr:S8 family serine peptidase [Mycoplasmopsis agassizii]PAK20999.1 hypothetical protein CJJ23_04295 [Mycoplasmopsis agassizii]